MYCHQAAKDPSAQAVQFTNFYKGGGRYIQYTNLSLHQSWITYQIEDYETSQKLSNKTQIKLKFYYV